MYHSRLLFVLTLMAVGTLSVAADNAPNALTNGGFEEAGDMGGAAGWTRGDPTLIKFVTEDDNRFCRIELPEKKAAIIHQTVDLDPAWKTLDFSVRIRASIKEFRDEWNEPWWDGNVRQGAHESFLD